MDSTEKLIGEILLVWLHVICTPLLFLGPLHPGTPGHPFNPMRVPWRSRPWQGSTLHLSSLKPEALSVDLRDPT